MTDQRNVFQQFQACRNELAKCQLGKLTPDEQEQWTKQHYRGLSTINNELKKCREQLTACKSGNDDYTLINPPTKTVQIETFDGVHSRRILVVVLLLILILVWYLCLNI